MSRRKPALAGTLAILLSLAHAPSALAHAHLRGAVPAEGATVAAAPEVILTFSEALEPKFSRIEVRDATGRRLDQGAPIVTPGNARQVRMALPLLPAGRYSVLWVAVSVDTHRTEGSFSFTVAP